MPQDYHFGTKAKNQVFGLHKCKPLIRQQRKERIQDRMTRKTMSKCSFEFQLNSRDLFSSSRLSCTRLVWIIFLV